MDLIQLYSATQRVVKSIETSGLMPALKHYRSSLRGQGDRAATEATLIQASNAYIEKTALFGDDEAVVINLLHLGQLGTASFWLDLTSDARSVEVRQAQSVAAYSKMMFAVSHLPSLLSLVRESSAVEGLRTDSSDTGALVLRLYDSIESASSPDRMSRLIDAVDLLYSACASVSDSEVNSLQLISVSGVAVRSIVFHGDRETANATQTIIQYLNKTAAGTHQDDHYSVEAIASELPFLDAIDELQRVGAISVVTAETASKNALEGAIMLLECGAQLVDHESSPDTGFDSAAVIAKLDADASSFDSIDAHIGGSIDARYDEVYQRERDKLVSESDAGPAEKETPSLPRGERSASTSTPPAKAWQDREDSIDDLIVDLNRLYGEQR